MARTQSYTNWRGISSETKAIFDAFYDRIRLLGYVGNKSDLYETCVRLGMQRVAEHYNVEVSED